MNNGVSNSPTSGANLVKESKEALKAMNSPKVEKEPDKQQPVECGLKNPCNFGIHNINFDKHNIVDNKRMVTEVKRKI